MLGRGGFEVNDAQRKHHPNTLPGGFSGLHLVCLLYVGMHRLNPDAEIGFDLSAECRQAMSLHQSGTSGI